MGTHDMKSRSAALLAVLLAGGALVATGGAAPAHHSFAMFDQEHPIEISGTIQEFKYVNPHSVILLEVKGTDGVPTVWVLEGPAPNLMMREGLSNRSIKAGDEVVITVDPLRSGAPGGSWGTSRIKFKDGRTIAAPR
jgi:Family of unknown function (DUF6152)